MRHFEHHLKPHPRATPSVRAFAGQCVYGINEMNSLLRNKVNSICRPGRTIATCLEMREVHERFAPTYQRTYIYIYVRARTVPIWRHGDGTDVRHGNRQITPEIQRVRSCIIARRCAALALSMFYGAGLCEMLVKIVTVSKQEFRTFAGCGDRHRGEGGTCQNYICSSM